MSQDQKLNHSGESNPTSQPEKIAVDEQKLLAKLSRKPEVPGTVRALFGGQNIKDLVDLLTTGPVLEADMLLLTGSMTPADLMQYTTLLPEYDQVELDIIKIVSRMVDHFKPRIPLIIRATQNREKKGSIPFLYDQINNLMKILSRPEIGHRNLTLSTFSRLLYTQLFSAIDDAMTLQERPLLQEILSVLDQIWHQAFDGLDFIGTQFIREKYAYLNTFCLRSNCEVFVDALAPKPQLSTAEREALKAELAADFEEIKELREYRKIFYTAHQLGNAKVAFFADDFINFEEGESHHGICTFQVVLDVNQPLLKPIVEINGGVKTFDVLTREGVLNLHFNRATGELAFTTSNGTSVALIMIEDQYLQLKKTLFELLKDYLRSKEPDIEDAFLPDPNRQIIETREAVEEIIEEKPKERKAATVESEEKEAVEEEQAVAEFTAEIKPKFKYIPTPTESPDEISALQADQPAEDPEKDRRRKKSKQEFIKRIRNLGPTVLLNMLKRLMGPPVKIQGSHYFFKSPKNNAVLPIPYHGQQPVKFPLLKACLEKWDMIEEFTLELGI
jgi:hypothetical protein